MILSYFTSKLSPIKRQSGRQQRPTVVSWVGGDIWYNTWIPNYPLLLIPSYFISEPFFSFFLSNLRDMRDSWLVLITTKNKPIPPLQPQPPPRQGTLTLLILWTKKLGPHFFRTYFFFFSFFFGSLVPTSAKYNVQVHSVEETD